MKTIVHLSDLHFGRSDKQRVKPILRHIREIKPDMVIVSGDLTERASEAEYIQARDFLKALKRPVFVIPGNHDIPLYNIFQRFGAPFKKYKTFVSSELSPVYRDKEFAIIGINTVRRFTISSGKISKKQVAEAARIIQGMDKNVIKIIVCHHPFDIPKDFTMKRHTHKVVAQGKMAVEILTKKGADMFLAGHLHVPNITHTLVRYETENNNAIIVQAGTAMSKRMRSKPVSFNVIRIKRPNVTVENYMGNKFNTQFNLKSTHSYVKGAKGWLKTASPDLD